MLLGKQQKDICQKLFVHFMTYYGRCFLTTGKQGVHKEGVLERQGFLLVSLLSLEIYPTSLETQLCL